MFTYTLGILQKLHVTISTDRLSTYVQLANGDPGDAIKLYVRNSSLSEALYTPLQGVEIVVRNAFHDRLASMYGQDWYDKTAVRLQYAQQRKVDEAKEKLMSKAKPLTPGRVVAELSFGFWVGILGSKYENHLWRPLLRRAFPHAPTPFLRKDVHTSLDSLRSLRNRIMHHEPIITRDLKRDHDMILSIIGWVCPDTQRWVLHHSRFDDVFTSKP